jgi:hypothetical protein
MKTMTHTTKAKAATKASKREKPQPIQLPPAIAERLRSLCVVADIDPSDFVASIIGEWIEDESIAEILIDGYQITDHGTIAEIYRLATGSAPIVPFPNATPRLMESPPPEPVMTHGIQLAVAKGELEAWALASADMEFSEWAVETLRTAATHPTGRKMRWNALPPGDWHQIALFFTEADDKAFRAQAMTAGVPVEIWARKTLKAAWDAKGGQA